MTFFISETREVSNKILMPDFRRQTVFIFAIVRIMINETQKIAYYKALIKKNSEYEGLFFVGVKSTGIFCRPTCPARKPKFENCEFFQTAKEAMIASYRACKRCSPLLPQIQPSPILKKLIEAIEAAPEKRWTDLDFNQIGCDASTARRQFKKRFNMTFIEYARARRMGIAFGEIRSGESILNAQLNAGYESSSGFRDAFSKIMGNVPAKASPLILKAKWIDTLIGPMIAIADERQLYLLEFSDRRGLEKEIERMRKRLKAAIIPGNSPILEQIETELHHYYSGKNFIFQTPIYLLGSPFQQSVWHSLMTIPVGTTWSYTDLAKTIGNEKAMRAVANANGANQLAIIIPCHRVIRADESIGGYGGGINRKEWLLAHEKNKYFESNL